MKLTWNGNVEAARAADAAYAALKPRKKARRRKVELSRRNGYMAIDELSKEFRAIIA